MLLKNFFAFAVLIFIIFGCTSDTTKDLIDNTPIERATYSENVKTIIDNNCIICHAAVPVNGAPMPLTTYNEVRDAMLNRPLIDRISRQNGEGGLMPNGGPRLPQNVIDIIIQWQTDGLEE